MMEDENSTKRDKLGLALDEVKSVITLNYPTAQVNYTKARMEIRAGRNEVASISGIFVSSTGNDHGWIEISDRSSNVKIYFKKFHEILPNFTICSKLLVANSYEELISDSDFLR